MTKIGDGYVNNTTCNNKHESMEESLKTVTKTLTKFADKFEKLVASDASKTEAIHSIKNIFATHMTNEEKALDEIKIAIKENQAALGDKVSWRTMTILIVIVGSILAVLYAQINAMPQDILALMQQVYK